MPIRNSAKALIIRDDKILLTKNKDGNGYFYLFPGGGQEQGETLHEALKRECIEEIGREVEVGELIHIREYIGRNHEHASFDYDVHQMEFYFRCSMFNEMDKDPAPTNPDSHQVGVEWMDLNELTNCRLYPKKIIHYLNKDLAPVVYLGDIN
ncbi:NUDIX domain-containing protein [Bacillus sp. CH30_1T]|jgi:8-oxo-dGTP diphosphatase|uniref:NUDIX domain-containing protein n=1 Tax=Bacillus sp. CH30_1T TaxID=2604836 RepID=UPI0011EDA621|nr:NUDIX domain-containing protein [Bacillus sp. CH30_1T]KAA0564464.1 NUDIX domain-containing protein [Bacillus sp. CH30_1T]